MGKGMVANLLKAGHAVTVYTRTKSRADDLIALGARWADSPAEAAYQADAAISMVGYPNDVDEVWRGPKGFTAGAKPGCVLIDMTTSSPALARDLAAHARAKGFGALDAPVSGGDRGAREGTLTIMVGGTQRDFDFAQPLFAAMGKTIVLQGDAGTGQLCKLANQIGIASGMIAMAEALAFAHATGLNLETTLRSISGGGASSWALLNLAPRVLKGDFAPGFYVKHFVKDIGLALDVAKEQRLSLPGLELAAKLYGQVLAAGQGDLGTQAIVRRYFELA
jgi:3-hydroxyisobutyrate dehydrogenase